MMTNVGDAAGVVALGFVAIREFFGYLKSNRNGNGNGNGTGKSGDKDPAYWQQEFRNAVIEVNELQITPALEKLAEAHTDLLHLLNERTKYFELQTNLLQELVQVSRQARK